MKKRGMLLVLLAFWAFAQSGWAQNRAGVVIQNSTGDVITRCIEFQEESITVETLLERSGFRLVTEQFSFGASICFLHDDGALDCSPHPQDWFWGFYVQPQDEWELAPVGISSATATHGDVFGFVYGPFGESPPPSASFESVCEVVSEAGLVIETSDGSQVIERVEFFGETITGLQLLEKSGLSFIANETSFGTAICSIDSIGQPADDCFGDPQGRFWGFNVLDANNKWISSPVGVDQSIVFDGNVHGWHFAEFGAEQEPVSREVIFGLSTSVDEWRLAY